MPITSARELFVHELEDMVSAEHIIVKMLPELRKEAQHPEAKSAFQEHETETKEQIKRLQQAFKLLGEKPEESTCYATEGLKQEHEALHDEKPTPEMLAMAGLLGAAKTEHYEIASYGALVQMAKDLGETEIADLLQQTLTEEEAMAKRVTGLAKTAGKAIKRATAD
jgi:ferritin-like metal-binding protein YciE